MGRLSALLEFGNAESVSKRKELLENERFIHRIGVDLAKELSEKKLFESEALNESALLIEEVIKTVYAGAEPFKCMRNVLPVIKTKSHTTRLVTSSSAGYAEEYAEGTEITDVTTDYDYTNISTKLIMTGTKISNSLKEDSLFDVIQLEIEKVGARLENKLNRDALVALLSGAASGNDIDPTTSVFTTAYLAQAKGKVQENNYFATKYVLLPYAEAQLWRDSNLAYVNRAGTEATLRQGKIGTLMGMEPYSLSVTTGSTSVYWDSTDDTNHYMGLVLDPRNAGMITMKRDISVKQAETILADSTQIVGSMRYGVGTIRSDAISRIVTNTA